MSDTLLLDLEREAQRTKDLNPLELEHKLRVVRSLIGSPEGREALRRELGYNFLFQDEALADTRPLISLLVPTRSTPKDETTKAVHEMMLLSHPHCVITPEPGISSSVVHWARNNLLVNLRKKQQPADYVLMMDDDMVPPPDALIKLLKHDLDIVAGACTVRKDPPLPNFRVWVPELLSYRTAAEWVDQQGRYMGEGLVEIAGVGAAFMLVRTSVLDKIGEYWLSCRYEREHLGMKEEFAVKLEEGRRRHARETGDEHWFEFLKHPYGDGEYGEDISFCFKAKDCGYKIFVDTSVKVGHIGTYPYGIDDYMSYKNELLAAKAAKAAEKTP